ncbi:MAG: squalene--hopene cyclase [Methylacidiphilales bacterium]|nr:squalene--hopene cyclase [Candidatus Methylacidiphilales bacterium]MDW8349878.1 squalene--hopene cyclase [Verrucomicrobiae bacterium]
MRTDTDTKLQQQTKTAEAVGVVVEADLAQRIEVATRRSQEFLLKAQHPDGYWIGELFVDVTLVCDVVLFMHWRGEVDPVKEARCVKHILSRQLPDGGWNIYPGGPSELNATVKAYIALKLAGFDAGEPLMQRARHTILRLGGVPRCNTYTKLFLALLGLYPWTHLPVIPSEMILLPNWFPFNIYEMSAWSRAMVVPLTIINHFKPTRQLPEEKQIHELFPYGLERAPFHLPWNRKKIFSLTNFFLVCDLVLSLLERCPWKPFRKRALKRAEEWILERIGDGSDGLGAIQPSMLYTCIALKALGYTDEHPVLKKALRDLQSLEAYHEEEDDFRVQPCFSPVWDTAITAVALAESGVPADRPELRKAARWLMDREVRIRGDWAVKNPHPEASGWAFEFNNIYYPDVDDTLKVLLALRHIEVEDEEEKQQVIERATRWVKSFQCKDGGWAAFDKDVTKKWLEDVPFADHNAILDPTCSDITARALELFGKLGTIKTERFIRRAVRYLRETQEEDGSWYGRWGVNYIYGTWQALRGLAAIGEDMNQDWILRARDWLEHCQNEDGGWGETPDSYVDKSRKGKGPSTPSQTAWALMGIMACGDLNRESVRRGFDYLCRNQNPDGSWSEPYLTGTGFPAVFYLKYDMYRNNWTLLALAEYRKLAEKQKERARAWAQSTLKLSELRSKLGQEAAV